MGRPKIELKVPFDHNGCRIYPPTKGDIRWRVQIPDSDGSRRFRRAKDRDDAIRIADGFTEVVTGRLSVDVAERTISELCDAYQADLERRAGLRRAGLEGGISLKYLGRQTSILRLHVKPVLGSLPVRDWTDAPQSQTVLTAAADNGNGKDGVQNIGSCMRAMVTFAHNHKWMPRTVDPMAGVAYSRRSHRQGHNVNFIPRDTLPTLDDTEAIIKGFIAIDEPRLAVMVSLARWSGLRYGELISLRPCDLPGLSRLVNVDWQVIQTDDMQFERTRPKGEKTRTSFYAPSLEHQLADLCDLVTLMDGPEGLLFPGQHKSGYIERRWFHRRWTRAAQTAGWEMKANPATPQWPVPKWSIQDFRHFAACWMLFDLKMDDANVAHHLGHYSSSFTRDQYTGVRGRPEEEARRLSEGW